MTQNVDISRWGKREQVDSASFPTGSESPRSDADELGRGEESEEDFSQRTPAEVLADELRRRGRPPNHWRVNFGMGGRESGREAVES